MKRAAALLTAVLLLGACGDTDPLLEPRSGGDATVDADGQDAFSKPIPTLDEAGLAAFDVGNRFFRETWQPAPGAADADGLGPRFNAASCIACHVDDGRSRGPTAGTVDTPGLIVFLEAAGADAFGMPLPDPVYGGQIQDRSVDGVPPEAIVVVDYEEVAGTYADGTPYSLRRPMVTLDEPSFGVLSAATAMSPRVAPPLIGVGLLEAVTKETVAGSADPDDDDRDGISGRVPIGRFGWRGTVADLEAQTLLALHRDIGITSTSFPDEDCHASDAACRAVMSGGAPEVGEGRIGAIVTYLQTLGVPRRRQLGDDAVVLGAGLFHTAGCDACHRPTLTTGTSVIDALSEQEIHPYTDLLLHDMGIGLADAGPAGGEWRTPPLWGIGLTGVVGGHTTFLHDGRARSLEEAILWHGGEAAAARRAFEEMTTDERDALIAFLRSL